MAESAQDLLKRGIAAAQAGQKDQARALLQQAVRLDPRNELTWLWLSSVAKDNQERVFCLRQLLQVNPQNEMALKGLRALGVAAAPGPAADRPAAAGVPVAGDQTLKAVQPLLDQFLAEYTAPVEPDFGFQWARKTRGRAGEQSAARLRVGMVAAVAVAAIALVALVALAGGSVITALTAASATPTPPPYTPTPTPTLGPTNTPSPTPRIPPTLTSTYEPALAALNGADQFKRGNVLTPTPAYKQSEYATEPDLKRMQDAYLAGNYAEAIDLAKSARTGSVEKQFDTYFYEAMSYAMQGDYDEAEDVLTSGDIIADGLPIEDFQNPGGILSGHGESTMALLNAAAGYVYYKQGRLDESASFNLSAIRADPSFDLPVLTQADVYLEQGRVGDAYDLVLRATTDQPRLRYNVLLLVRLGEIELLRGDPDAALTLARKVLYIDPLAESAYRLAVDADLAFGQAADRENEAVAWYGRAVLDLEAYLLYYPDSVTGWALMGKARYLEGNLDRALPAYDRALSFDIPEDAMTPDLRAALQEAYLARATMYAERRLYLQAIEDYTGALQLGDSRAALEGRARASFTIQDYNRARLDLETLLEADPDNVEYQLMLAQILVDTKEYEEAQPILQTLLGSGRLTVEQTGAVRESLALTYYRLAGAQSADERDSALVEQANTHIEEALAIGKTGTRYYYRGLIREMAGAPDLAKHDYEWLLVWQGVYSYDFMPDVEARLEEIDKALAAGGGS
ncbi:MAG: tetratricopeptide repeat protein [Anaerolineae bacterium]|nr:tetratricopeptide repeat protein [Anaerolineae bacterium]